MRFDAIGNAGTNCGGEGSCGTCLVSITDGFDLCNEPMRTEGKALLKQVQIRKSSQ
jgi:ferredoxin